VDFVPETWPMPHRLHLSGRRRFSDATIWRPIDRESFEKSRSIIADLAMSHVSTS
jgi:hypothetical protein